MNFFATARKSMTFGVESLSLPFNASFWPAIARLVLDRPAAEIPVVLVSNQLQAGALREALAGAASAMGRVVFLPPPIRLVDEWALAEAVVLGHERSRTTRQIELYEALGATEWLARSMRGNRSTLWPLARQILKVCDELTLALGRAETDGTPPDIERRLLALIRGTYRDRAWQACSMEADLIASIWQLTLSREDGPALTLRSLDRIALSAARPLVIVEPEPPAGYVQSFLTRYAERQPVLRIVVDLARTMELAPALRFSWPELVDEWPAGDLARRAGDLAQNGAMLAHFGVMGATGLEAEAVCVAQQVLSWLDAGAKRIGMVALDRVVARRVRALLERACVLVADESGWKLSTTIVAGVLMRFIDIAQAGPEQCETAALLDWLKSPYAMANVDDKPAVLAELESALRADNVVRGLAAMQASLQRRRRRFAQSDAVHLARIDGAMALLASVGQDMGSHGEQSFKAHFRWLEAALAHSGMQQAFSTDQAGTVVLALTDQLSRDARDDGWQRLSFVAWKEFLADAFENATFRADDIESPVVLTSLDGAALRQFDALVFIGADARHLPAQDTDMLFFTPALRAELGLDDRAARQRQELARLAILIAATPNVVATFQTQSGGEQRPLAGAFERLAFVHRLAFGDDLRRTWRVPGRPVKSMGLGAPAPRAPQNIPLRLSASGYNKLVSCPYRYFAQYVLRLDVLDEVTEEVEKRQYGELVHRALELFHEGETANDDRVAQVGALRSATARAFAERDAEHAAFLGYRERFESLIPDYVDWWTSRRATGWRFQAAELSSERNLMLDDGAELVLHGRIDRIDERAAEIAVIDYKATSKKSLAERLAEPGEDVQLPFYTLLLHERPVVESFYLSVDRNEVDQVPKAQSALELAELALAVEQRIRNNWLALRRGAPLAAQGSDDACRHCEHRGLCRKGQWREDLKNQGAR